VPTAWRRQGVREVAQQSRLQVIRTDLDVRRALEIELELAFLENEGSTEHRRLVAGMATLLAVAFGLVVTAWAFAQHVPLGLLCVYSLPLFVLAVVLGAERALARAR
jgi:hypothetical protein